MSHSNVSLKCLTQMLFIGLVMGLVIERREDGDVISGDVCPHTRPIAGCRMEVGGEECCQVSCMSVADFEIDNLDYMPLHGGDFALKRKHHINEYILFDGCKWVSIIDQLVYQGRWVLFAYKKGALYAVLGTKRRYAHMFHANGIYQRPPTPHPPLSSTRTTTEVRPPTVVSTTVVPTTEVAPSTPATTITSTSTRARSSSTDIYVLSTNDRKAINHLHYGVE